MPIYTKVNGEMKQIQAIKTKYNGEMVNIANIMTKINGEMVSIFSTDWRQPADWKAQNIDLRKTAPENSIALLAGVKSDYSDYDNLGFIATCTGGYKVFIDGVQYGETYASATQCNITWSNYTATQGKNITTPDSLIAHEIHIVPATSGNNITAFHCARVASSGTEQQGVLWTHFNTNDYINLQVCFCGVEGGVYNNRILKALTAPKNVLKVSNIYTAFYNCNLLEYLPILQSDGRVVKNYQAFRNCQTIKNISLKNMLFNEIIDVFHDCFALEQIKTNNVILNLTNSVAGNDTYLNCYKLKKIIPATYTSSIETMTNYIINAESLQNTILDVRSATGLKVIRCYGSNTHFMTGFKGLRVSNQAPFDSTTSPQINVPYTGMDRQALVQLFNDLPSVNEGQIININGCSGSELLSPSDLRIATNKGWSVIGGPAYKTYATFTGASIGDTITLNGIDYTKTGNEIVRDIDADIETIDNTTLNEVNIIYPDNAILKTETQLTSKSNIDLIGYKSVYASVPANTNSVIESNGTQYSSGNILLKDNQPLTISIRDNSNNLLYINDMSSQRSIYHYQVISFNLPDGVSITSTINKGLPSSALSRYAYNGDVIDYTTSGGTTGSYVVGYTKIDGKETIINI